MKDANKSIEQLEAEINKLADERDALFKRIKPLEDQLQSKYKRIEKLSELASQKRIDAGGFDYRELLNANGGRGGDMVRYRHMNETMRNLGFMGTGGYNPKTNQYCIKFSVPSKADASHLGRLEQAFETIMPHLIPSDGEAGLKSVVYLDLFEDTLSEYGIYFVYAQPDTGKFFLCKTTYGRTEQLKAFDTCRQMLEYVRDNHPYGEDD